MEWEMVNEDWDSLLEFDPISDEVVEQEIIQREIFTQILQDENNYGFNEW